MGKPKGEVFPAVPSPPLPPEVAAVAGGMACGHGGELVPQGSPGLLPPGGTGEEKKALDFMPNAAAAGGAVPPGAEGLSGEEYSLSLALLGAEETSVPQCGPTEVRIAVGDLVLGGSPLPSQFDGKEGTLAVSELDANTLRHEKLGQSAKENEQPLLLPPPPSLAEAKEAAVEECEAVSAIDGHATGLELMDHSNKENVQLPRPSLMEAEVTAIREREPETLAVTELDPHAIEHELTGQTNKEDKQLPPPPPEQMDGEEADIKECRHEKHGGETEDCMPQGSPPASPSDSIGEFNKTALSEPDTASAGADDAMDDEATKMDVEEEEEVFRVRRLRKGGGRRKRGRAGRTPKAQVARTLKRRKYKEREKVCFICFDGGDLVVCDRRACPKVYHPSCVDRDEAFFRAKGSWNCGWHICSICQNAAHYMCLTCTHSLCKGCIKEAEFLCVRGNKGLCVTCMSTVMLIETKDGNATMVGVDFDDKNSFDYLFKAYWLKLKAKLSLTLEDLVSAKNLRKGSDEVIHNEESPRDLCNGKEGTVAGSDDGSMHQEEILSSRSKGRKRLRNTSNEESSVKEGESTGTSTSEDVNWASNALLEFVAHMRNGDRSVLSQLDVQTLLLEYIRRKKLRDPCKKNQIVCDSRLENLFGKSCVGHFEMLKLLESHFLLKEASPFNTEDNQGGVEDPDPSQVDDDGKHNVPVKFVYRRRRKRCRKGEGREQTNLSDYAAIDVHNISLMYLRWKLMLELVEDTDTLDDKVVGSFVRIKISGSGERQDVYRLVQVVGTGRTAEKYKIGKKITDVTLEIQNLDKTEVITIDIISNQEFTEEECKRLRQSIKCGLIGRLRVGDVQEKARALQTLRVNDWMEREKLRLAHLRDRASEKGHKKDLRECVEKLQLLSTLEERRRRLNEVPEIHTDPHMDPDYESPEEEQPEVRKQDEHNRSSVSSFLRNRREEKDSGKGVSISSNKWSIQETTSIRESNRSILEEGACIPENSASRVKCQSSSNQGVDAYQATISEAPTDRAILNGPQSSKQDVALPGGSSDAPSAFKTTSPSAVILATSTTSESEKIWHYQDPSGKVQGPFSMTQLRKWSTKGFFPSDLRIWKVSEKQDNSILLTDALVANFQKDLPQWQPPTNSIAPMRNVLPSTIHGRGANVESAGAAGDISRLLTDNKQQHGENLKTLGGHEKLPAQLSASLSLPNANKDDNNRKLLDAVSGTSRLPACTKLGGSTAHVSVEAPQLSAPERCLQVPEVNNANNSLTGSYALPSAISGSSCRADPMLSNTEHIQWLPTDASNLMASSDQFGANMNMGFGPPPQVDMMNPGWGALAQGNTRTNMAWTPLPPPPVSTNQIHVGWGAQMQENMTANPGSGMLINCPRWPANQANANRNLGTPAQGTMSPSPWGSSEQQGNNVNHNNFIPSAGNANNGWNSQQEAQSGARHPSQTGAFGSNNSRHAAQEHMMHPGRPPLPPSRRLICRFHAAGHCKKGGRCNHSHS